MQSRWQKKYKPHCRFLSLWDRSKQPVWMNIPFPWMYSLLLDVSCFMLSKCYLSEYRINMAFLCFSRTHDVKKDASTNCFIDQRSHITWEESSVEYGCCDMFVVIELKMRYSYAQKRREKKVLNGLFGDMNVKCILTEWFILSALSQMLFIRIWWIIFGTLVCWVTLIQVVDTVCLEQKDVN